METVAIRPRTPINFLTSARCQEASGLIQARTSPCYGSPFFLMGNYTVDVHVDVHECQSISVVFPPKGFGQFPWTCELIHRTL